MEDINEQKGLAGWFHAHKKKLIIMLIIIASAWLLGQLIVPVIMKAIFL